MRVRLHFLLVGKTMNKSKILSSQEWNNSNSLDFVKNTVKDQFGSVRPMLVVNEQSLKNSNSTYPKFYSAGWFVSEADPLTELVVVAHGDSMASARNFMMDSMNLIDWKLDAKLV